VTKNSFLSIKWLGLTLGVGLAGLISLLLVLCRPSLAADQPDKPEYQISVSPSSLRVTDLVPGQTATGSYELSNTGRKDVGVEIYAAPMSAASEFYEKNYDLRNAYNQIADWISFDETNYDLIPDQSVTVTYYITVPSDVPAGGQYAGIMNKMIIPGQKLEGTGINSEKRIGLNVYSVVAGDTRLSGQLIEAKADLWQPEEPLTGTVRIKNDGNVDFEVKASMQVRSLFGKLRYSSDPVTVRVLPETTRAITSEWNGASIGIYKVTLETELMLDDKVTRIVERWVIVLPIWAIALAILIGLALILLGVNHLRKATKSNKKFHRHDEK
jgi:hypothetical protein